MQYIGIASRLLPLVGRFFGFVTDKAKANPKTGDTALALAAAASVFGFSPETRVMIGKVLVYVGQALQAVQ